MNPNNNNQNGSQVVVPQPSLAPSVLGSAPGNGQAPQTQPTSSATFTPSTSSPSSSPQDDAQSLSQMVGAEQPQEDSNPLQKLASKLTKFKDSLVEETSDTPTPSTDVNGSGAEENSTPPIQSQSQTNADTPKPDPFMSSSSMTPPAAPPASPMPTPDESGKDVAELENAFKDLSSLSPEEQTPATEIPTPDQNPSEIPAADTNSDMAPTDTSAGDLTSTEAVDPLTEMLSGTSALEKDEKPAPTTPIEEPQITLETPMPGSTVEPKSESPTVEEFSTAVGPEPMPISKPDSIPMPKAETQPESKLATEATETPPPASSGKYPYTIFQLLDIVFERNASDLHISVGYPAFIRVDGMLQPVSQDLITDEIAEELIFPVLPDNKKELLEVNREVDLAYAYKQSARFRINAYYQQQSLAAAFRLIPNRIRTIDELMLPQIYHQLAKLRQGLVLVTGPTGSGKSSTLAAILQEVNEARAEHIITIEDPIEYVFPKAKALVDQRELHEDTHSWEIAMKSALRQDPDVVLVGEMRDYETISAAITLAETGHLVFATLHTNSAAQTIDRVIDVFPEHQQSQVRSQLSNTIEAVIAQRLIPIDGGGRRAVSEIMIATPAIRNLVREGKTHQIDNVIRTSADIGMFSIEKSLVDLVREGKITMERAQEYAVHPEEVVRLLKG